MTAISPSSDDKPRKGQDTLYVTDAEIIRRSGIPRDRFYKILPEIEGKHRFPKKEPLFCGRRYWPAVKSWFDDFSGQTASDPRRTAR